MLVLSLVAAAAERAGAAATALSDAGADHVHAATVVPDPARKVGRVRLVSRGSAVVVQTLLETKLLSRIVAEIRQKEEASWGKGNADVEAYLAALESVRETLEKRGAGADWKQRRRRMLIEFAADDSGEAVYVGTFADGDDENAVVPGREILATPPVSRAYVLRDVRLILADSFKTDERDVGKLGPLGPAAAP